MYSQLSNSQQAVLENDECPHCHSKGSVQKVWTRNGPTVKCNNCGKKVYRPRGRAVSQGTGLTGGSSSGNPGSIVPAGNDGSESESSEQSEQEGQGQGQGKPSQPSQAAQAASKSLGKPLSEAAQEAFQKIENALRDQAAKELRAAIEKMEQDKQDMKEQMEQDIDDKVESLRPKEIIVKHVDQDEKETQPTVNVPNSHKLLPEILWRITAGIKNFLLVGPSGSGKTTLAEQIAKALGVPFGLLPWSGDTTPGTVLGRPSPDGSVFNLSAWLQLYTQSSVWCHDELDGSDPNVPICMNSAIENGKVYLPSGLLIRHKSHVVTATANTWGIGADMLYCGRNQLDAAVRDRFVGGVIFVDYDADLEASLVPEKAFLAPFWEIRQRIFEHKLRRIWGTRTLVRGAMLWRAGKSVQDTFRALTAGFSQDECQKIGVA